MRNSPHIALVALHEDLQHYHALASAEIPRMSSDPEAFDRHMMYGAQFHRTASTIRQLTGIDPRERYNA